MRNKVLEGVRCASIVLSALLACGWASSAWPAGHEDGAESPTQVSSDRFSPASGAVPDCDDSSFKELTIQGGLCVGLCGEGGYQLNTWLETAPGFVATHFAGRLQVQGSKWWNRRLRASATTSQNLTRANTDWYRSDLAIVEPVNGPASGRYRVSYHLVDTREGRRQECRLQREREFSDRFRDHEKPGA